MNQLIRNIKHKSINHVIVRSYTSLEFVTFKVFTIVEDLYVYISLVIWKDKMDVPFQNRILHQYVIAFAIKKEFTKGDEVSINVIGGKTMTLFFIITSKLSINRIMRHYNFKLNELKTLPKLLEIH